MKNRTHILIAVALLVVLAALGAVMREQIAPRLDLPFDIQSTTLAAEFASMPDEIIAVLGSDHRHADAIRTQQYLDFPFIVCYVSLFVLIALALRDYDVPAARWLSWLAIVAAILAGLFDIGENISILRTLSVPNAITSNVRWFSLPKWGLVFLVLAVESIVFFFWPRLTLWWRLGAVVVGSLFLFVGGSGLLFSMLASVPDIAWSAQWMTWAMISLLLFLAAVLIRPRLSKAGGRLRY